MLCAQYLEFELQSALFEGILDAGEGGGDGAAHFPFVAAWPRKTSSFVLRREEEERVCGRTIRLYAYLSSGAAMKGGRSRSALWDRAGMLGCCVLREVEFVEVKCLEQLRSLRLLS